MQQNICKIKSVIFIEQFCFLQPIICESSALIPALVFQCFEKTLWKQGIWRGECGGQLTIVTLWEKATYIQTYMYVCIQNRLYSTSRCKYQPKVLID